MFLQIIILIIGFIVLIKGADLFVDAASSLATNFKVSKMLIALTIVAFGTSAPELAVSIKSMASGSGDIVLGNVLGSNVLNILLILGVSGLVHYLNVKNATVRKELPITILLSSILFVTMNDTLISVAKANSLTRSDGIITLLFFSVFVYYLISTILCIVLDMLNNKSNISNNQTPITPRKYLQGKSLVNSLASNTYISYCLTLRQT